MRENRSLLIYGSSDMTDKVTKAEFEEKNTKKNKE
jgi:hypothetical protein